MIDRFLFCVVRVFRGSFPYVHFTALCNSLCFCVFRGSFSPQRLCKRMTNHGMHGIHGNEVIDRFLFCVVRVFSGSFPYVHYTALCKPLCFCVFSGSFPPQRLCKRMTNHGMHGIHGNEVIDRFLFCVVRVFCGSFSLCSLYCAVQALRGCAAATSRRRKPAFCYRFAAPLPAK